MTRRDIDYSVISELYYLGNYTRAIPVSMTRMMENVRDWEHLPFVHPSSFAAIECGESGDWGWIADVTLPSGEPQALQLLIDEPQHYWSTTVRSGPGSGVHIHTQANVKGLNAIAIDVRFYSETPPADAARMHSYLATLYARLYDEDAALMQGRQAALDCFATPVETNGPDIGDAARDRHLFTVGGKSWCARRFEGQWLAHAAQCPHMLGPLQDAKIAEDGSISCPWHGYRFDVRSGKNCDGKAVHLPSAPQVYEINGRLGLKRA